MRKRTKRTLALTLCLGLLCSAAAGTVEAEQTELLSHDLLTVTGTLPAGTQLKVEEGSVSDYSDFDITNTENVKAVLDITLEDGGLEYQPYTHGQQVCVTLDAEKLGLADGTLVRVHHLHEGEVRVIEPLTVEAGKILFSTDSFSLYLVESLGSTDTAREITAGSVFTMTVGQEQVFYCDDEGALWTVEDRQSVLHYTALPQADAPKSIPWIKVRGEKAGTAKIIIEANQGENNPSVTITVTEKGGFHIENKVAESGCLIPVWEEGAPDGVRYEWKRSDGVAVVSAAKGADGSVNVSTDRGGVTNSSAPITYTVTATDSGGKVLGRDSYEITYGNEILNPSFEAPAGTTEGTYWQLPNGTPGLYWKTTAPGAGRGPAYIGADIEFAYGDNNPYGIGAAAHGDQFVELNAEGFGTLYQDILTTGGADLEWSFSHTSRTDVTNKMYVVIAATQYAQRIIDLEDIQALITAATTAADTAGVSIPGGGEGFAFTHNGGTYRIWHDESTKAAQTAAEWNHVSGAYAVPEGQYLTRLFFVSDPYHAPYGDTSMTKGNIIDGVFAGEHMSYRVEYYKENVLQEQDTEGQPYVATHHTVDLENLEAYLGEYPNAHKILINGRTYPGTLQQLLTTGLYIASYGEKPETMTQTQDIVLQIYFQKVDIIVTKEFVFQGWEKLPDAKKNEILGDGITAVFGLYENGQKLSEAEVTVYSVSATGQLVAQAAFEGVNSDYFGRTFTVQEESAPAFDGYKLKSGIRPQTFTLTEDLRIKELYFSNLYEQTPFDLTVKKTGWEQTDEHQVFLFRITGEKGFSLDVTVTGNGEATVKDLPPGEYTVTELTDWSWRYTPQKHQQRVDSVDAVKGVVQTVFKNTRQEEFWLSGDSRCENRWDGERVTEMTREE